MTPRLIEAVLDGAAARMRTEFNQTAWLAWHIEALARAKKLPKLKDLMSTEAPKPRRRQTVEEQIAIARQWTVALTRN